MTVDFGTPLKAGRVYPLPTATCVTNNGKVELKIKLSDKVQAKIIDDAVHILECVWSERIKDMFSYYTDNKEALAIASKIEDIYKSIA